MSTPPDLLSHPPFPLMKWGDHGDWEGKIALPPYGSRGLTVIPDAPEVSRIPSPEQAAACSFQLENSPGILDAILKALLPHYQKMRPRYRDFLGEEFERVMPAIERPDALTWHVDLKQVYIHPWAKDGCAYVGWLFGCTWDAEHGLGAMLHRDRVVEIGSADVSFAWAPKETDVQS